MELPRTSLLIIAICLGLSTSALCADGSVSASERRTGVVTMGGEPLTLLGHPIEVGETAPDFTVIDRNMKPVSLSDFEGEVRIVTIFPSVDTKVCSLQARTFNQRAARLDDVRVLTVSLDLPFALDRFCAAEGIDRVLTLSDHRETDFGLKYGYLIDELRLLARGTVIVDQGGVVRYVEYVGEINSEPDYDRAVAVARELARR